MSEWKQMGFQIAGEARNGKEALDKLENEKFDMVLVDVMMPIMNGLDLLKEIQERKIHIISIIASTYKEFDYVRTGMRLGALDYLLKPVSKEALMGCLSEVRERLEEQHDPVEQIFITCGADIKAGFVQKVMGYFRNHHDVYLGEIAEEFQLSKDYFGKLFKEQMGENFNHFMLQYKMELAKRMLGDYEYKIYEISEKLGYKSTDYFAKLFKEYEGETPIQYRKNIQNNGM